MHTGTYTHSYTTHSFIPIDLHISTKRGREKDLGRTSRDLQQWVCHLLWGRQILPSLCSKLDFLRMWACVSLLVTRPWHTLCAVKAGGGRDKVSADYPPSENPHAVWRSARGPLSFLSRSEYHYCQWIRLLSVVTVKTQWPWWCVKNIHHSMLHWKISQWGGAIISLGTAKPLRDLYLTRLAV